TRPPVDDRRAERDLALVDGGAGEDAAVSQERLAEAPVEVVELVRIGAIGEPAEADDVEGDVGESLELGLGIDPGGEALGEVEVALDHRPVATSPVGTERRPHREGPGPPGALRAAVAEARSRVIGGGEVV